MLHKSKQNLWRVIPGPRGRSCNQKDRSRYDASSYARMLPVSAATEPLQAEGVPLLGFHSNNKGQRSTLSRGCRHDNIHMSTSSGCTTWYILCCSKLLCLFKRWWIFLYTSFPWKRVQRSTRINYTYFPDAFICRIILAWIFGRRSLQNRKSKKKSN